LICRCDNFFYSVSIIIFFDILSIFILFIDMIFAHHNIKKFNITRIFFGRMLEKLYFFATVATWEKLDNWQIWEDLSMISYVVFQILFKQYHFCFIEFYTFARFFAEINFKILNFSIESSSNGSFIQWKILNLFPHRIQSSQYR
jgi:hypothetical protein